MNTTFSQKRIELLDLHCFKSRSDLVQYIILDYMYRTGEIAGSWMLQVVIEDEGLEISVASVGRALKELDVRGYTESVNNKGRVITAKGIEFLLNKRSKVEHELLQKRLVKSTTPEDFYQLLDLVRARRVLETESARLAAWRVTQENIEEIQKSLEKQKRLVENGKDQTKEAWEFHVMIAKASKNQFIKSSIELLIYYNSQLELRFPELITREQGPDYSHDHFRIAEAVIGKNPKEAEREMHLHMTKILEDIKRQSDIITEEDNIFEVYDENIKLRTKRSSFDD